MNDRLYRSVDDRVLAGVCGGLADRMDIDPSAVRIGYAIIAILTGVAPMLLVYVIMAIVVPEEPAWTGVRPVDPIGSPSGGQGPSSWQSGWTAATSGAPGQGGSFGPQAGAPPTGAPPTGAPPTGAPPTGAYPGPQGFPGWVDPVTGSGGSWRADRHAAREARRAERAARRAARRGDPLPAMIGGLFLVAVGGLLLLRGTLNVDWSVVWPAAIVAAGVLLVAVAILPRSR